MRNYKIFILNKLIDSYENSVLYKGESKRDNKIYFKFYPWKGSELNG